MPITTPETRGVCSCGSVCLKDPKKNFCVSCDTQTCPGCQKKLWVNNESACVGCGSQGLKKIPCTCCGHRSDLTRVGSQASFIGIPNNLGAVVPQPIPFHCGACYQNSGANWVPVFQGTISKELRGKYIELIEELNLYTKQLHAEKEQSTREMQARNQAEKYRQASIRYAREREVEEALRRKDEAKIAEERKRCEARAAKRKITKNDVQRVWTAYQTLKASKSFHFFRRTSRETLDIYEEMSSAYYGDMQRYLAFERYYLNPANRHRDFHLILTREFAASFFEQRTIGECRVMSPHLFPSHS